MTPTPAELASFFQPHATEPACAGRSTPTLAALLDPVTVQEFASEFFGRQPLRLPSNAARTSLYSLEQLRAALLRARQTRPEGFELRGTFSSGETTTRGLFSIEYPQIAPILEHGGTICVTGLHHADESIAALAAGAKISLGHSGTCGVNGYLSAAHSGFNPHFDARVATSIQIAGAKTWRYGREAALPFPPRNWLAGGGRERPVGDDPPAAWETPTPFATTDLVETTLHPGDLLCLPAGAWHVARAEGFSFALNLYFEHTSFAETVASVLSEHFTGRSAWRAGVPPLVDAAGNVRRCALDYVRERLRELVGFASGLAEDDQLLLDAVIQQTAGTSPKGAGVPTRRQPAVVADAEDGDTVAMSANPPPFVCVRPTADSEPVVSLAQGSVLLNGGPEHAALFRALAAGQPIALEDLYAAQVREDLPRAEVQQVVQHLLDSGAARLRSTAEP